MEDPTFHLDGVVKTKDALEDFEGPLVLILQLLSKNKIEIQDIQISSLLDQYLEYLDRMKSMDLEIASEFVAMASHLVYIKARTLLSVGDENPELDELIETLEKLKIRGVYESIRGVTDKLSDMYLAGAGAMTKPPEPLKRGAGYRYVHEKTDLIDAMLRIRSRAELEKLLNNAANIPIPKKIVYSVTEKTEEILSMLRDAGRVPFDDVFAGSRSRSELVAAFIALLELCHAGSVRIEGKSDALEILYCGENAA